MEFERGIYRMHERALHSRRCPKYLSFAQYLVALITLVAAVNFLSYHIGFVNQSRILRSAMQDQLLNNMIDNTLPYSKQDEFSFCNIQTWAAND